MIGTCVYVVYAQAVIGTIAPNHHHHLVLPVGIHVSFTTVLFAPTFTVTQTGRKTRATCVMRSYIARYSQRLMLAILHCQKVTACSLFMWHSLLRMHCLAGNTGAAVRRYPVDPGFALVRNARQQETDDLMHDLQRN